eukprot:132697-Rhodomonas_salina.1
MSQQPQLDPEATLQAIIYHRAGLVRHSLILVPGRRTRRRREVCTGRTAQDGGPDTASRVATLQNQIQATAFKVPCTVCPATSAVGI